MRNSRRRRGARGAAPRHSQNERGTLSGLRLLETNRAACRRPFLVGSGRAARGRTTRLLARSNSRARSTEHIPGGDHSSTTWRRQATITMNVNAQIHYRDLPVSHPSGRTHSQLHQLKRKLLRVALEETPETELFKRLSGAANQAAELAWATSYPLLVFPHLFDEMVKAVRERFQQEQISDGQSSLTSSDADLRFEDIHSVPRWSDPIFINDRL